MTKVRHTSGPWVIEIIYPEGDFQCRILAKGKGVDGCDLIIAGEPSKRGGRANIHFEANARLIASAPELLETTKYALDSLKANGITPHNKLRFEWLKEVLAKAEGTNDNT